MDGRFHPCSPLHFIADMDLKARIWWTWILSFLHENWKKREIKKNKLYFVPFIEVDIYFILSAWCITVFSVSYTTWNTKDFMFSQNVAGKAIGLHGVNASKGWFNVSAVYSRVSMGHGGKPWVADFSHPHFVAGQKAVEKGECLHKHLAHRQCNYYTFAKRYFQLAEDLFLWEKTLPSFSPGCLKMVKIEQHGHYLL